MDEHELYAFLRENAKNQELVEQAIREVGPIFEKLKSGRYKLAGASGKIANHMRDCLALATDREAYRVTFISEARPLLIGSWASERIFPVDLKANIWLGLKYCVRQSLGIPVFESFRDKSRYSFGLGLSQGLVNFVLSYLTFVLAGDSDKVENLTPLIRFLTESVPLREKRGKPGTWIVLCA